MQIIWHTMGFYTHRFQIENQTEIWRNCFPIFLSAIQMPFSNSNTGQIDENSSQISTASKASNAYTKRLERHLEELKIERKTIISRIRKLQEKAEKEETMGSHHRMKNIQLVPTTDRIVGGLNIRLRIHENGSDKILQTVVVNLDTLLKKGNQENDGNVQNDPLKLLYLYIAEKLSEGKF